MASENKSEHHELRSEAAKAIRNARNADRNPKADEEYGYFTDRDLPTAIQVLGGLEYCLDYIRSNPVSKTLLEIGAGKTKMLSQLSRVPYFGRNLNYEATVLDLPGKLPQDSLPREKIHITSAEVLRGIQDNSIGGIIEVFALMHSGAPELCAESINRVLVNGGVIKGVSPLSAQDSLNRLVNSFGKLGYESYSQPVYISLDPSFPETATVPNANIFIAKKPQSQATPAGYSCKQLFQNDFSSWQSQQSIAKIEVAKLR